MEESLENVAVQIHKFYSTEACQQKISELKMLMQLELLMHVAARPGGYAETVSGCETCRDVRDVSREGQWTEPRHGQ